MNALVDFLGSQRLSMSSYIDHELNTLAVGVLNVVYKYKKEMHIHDDAMKY